MSSLASTLIRETRRAPAPAWFDHFTLLSRRKRTTRSFFKVSIWISEAPVFTASSQNRVNEPPVGASSSCSSRSLGFRHGIGQTHQVHVITQTLNHLHGLCRIILIGLCPGASSNWSAAIGWNTLAPAVNRFTSARARGVMPSRKIDLG